jgi:SAPK-interacting protein 1 (Sin1), Pleckstrin-homology
MNVHSQSTGRTFTYVYNNNNSYCSSRLTRTCFFVVVQIMPTANKAAKAVFDSGKTSSYHINSVVSCQTGKSSSAAFHIVVHRVSRDGGNKRYEFEAESAKVASACFVPLCFIANMSQTNLPGFYRRDCADYQGPQICIGALRQYLWQSTAVQAHAMIPLSTGRRDTPAPSHFPSFPYSRFRNMSVSIATACTVCALDSE